MVRRSAGGAEVELDLHAATYASGSNGERNVLHLISLPSRGIERWGKRTRTLRPAERAKGDARLAGWQGLSEREQEVLALLASGFDTGRISDRLFISVATVRNHISSILRKLGVHSRLGAVLIWLGRETETGCGSL